MVPEGLQPQTSDPDPNPNSNPDPNPNPNPNPDPNPNPNPNKVAAMVGDNKWHVKPRMGEYILLNKNQGHQAKHVLFPCPHPVYGKGVLVQSTLWGNLILGPTARDTMRKNEARGSE